MKDVEYMTLAIQQAKLALDGDDVPVGCVIVKNDEVIALGYNEREKNNMATSHAEVVAINEACKKLGSWRLNGCTLYVTLEPCPMCAGAIINSRISKVVIGAKDPKAGSLGSVINMNSYPFNHKVELQYGVLEEECKKLLTDFFKNKR